MNAIIRGARGFKILTEDGLNCSPLEERELEVREDDGSYTKYKFTLQTTSDGASNPTVARFLGMLLQTVTRLKLAIEHYGTYWKAAFWHDAFYRRTVLVLDEKRGEWISPVYSEVDPLVFDRRIMTRARADGLLRAIMFGLGTDETTSTAIYEALRAEGQTAWDEDALAPGGK